MGLLYLSIDGQNEITALQMEIPRLSREVRLLNEENTRLKYQIDQFENPHNLMQLAKSDYCRHLKHPLVETVFAIPEGLALELNTPKEAAAPFKLPLFLGAKK
ncbi:MAG: hypothetical protein SP1CHLAM54_01120 [Chlamydiia bacterium]|nr:hypothetical protein [Chlamydiia bacterium]